MQASENTGFNKIGLFSSLNVFSKIRDIIKIKHIYYLNEYEKLLYILGKTKNSYPRRIGITKQIIKKLKKYSNTQSSIRQVIGLFLTKVLVITLESGRKFTTNIEFGNINLINTKYNNDKTYIQINLHKELWRILTTLKTDLNYSSLSQLINNILHTYIEPDNVEKPNNDSNK